MGSLFFSTEKLVYIMLGEVTVRPDAFGGILVWMEYEEFVVAVAAATAFDPFSSKLSIIF